MIDGRQALNYIYCCPSRPSKGVRVATGFPINFKGLFLYSLIWSPFRSIGWSCTFCFPKVRFSPFFSVGVLMAKLGVTTAPVELGPASIACCFVLIFSALILTARIQKLNRNRHPCPNFAISIVAGFLR